MPRYPLIPHKWPNAVRIRNLIAEGRRLEVHCNKCARFRTLDPSDLPLPGEPSVPALEGLFRCTRCGSRETQARPHYRRD